MRRASRWDDQRVSSPLQRRWTPDWPVHLVHTLGPLRHGRSDPTLHITDSGVWRTTRSPAGPVTIHYARSGGEVVVTAWGPGAQDALDTAPHVLGQTDDPGGFPAAAHAVVAAAHSRFGAGWRGPRTQRVLEALIPAILEQRVTGLEAKRAWAWLVGRYGQDAPGPEPGDAHGDWLGTTGPFPAGLRVVPDAQGWLRVPSWAWHRAGVDPGRSASALGAAARAQSLERLSARRAQEAGAALRSLPGIGVWTSAEVGIRAWGDRDAVSFGDFHLAGFVVHALTGRLGGTDEQMAELLAPWAGQRARAVRMLELHCPPPPRRAPRATITDHRRH
jgi:3-methyladenine DNA glycosylase/8-oxoguanine DNA glycosylase